MAKIAQISERTGFATRTVAATVAANAEPGRIPGKTRSTSPVANLSSSHFPHRRSVARRIKSHSNGDTIVVANDLTGLRDA